MNKFLVLFGLIALAAVVLAGETKPKDAVLAEVEKEAESESSGNIAKRGITHHGHGHGWGHQGWQEPVHHVQHGWGHQQQSGWGWQGVNSGYGFKAGGWGWAPSYAYSHPAQGWGWQPAHHHGWQPAHHGHGHQEAHGWGWQ